MASTGRDILAAARRSELTLCQQVSQWEPLSFAVAHRSTAFPHAFEANQLREVWLADVDGEDAYEQCEDYYRRFGAVCRAWSPAEAQDPTPVAEVLEGRGWRSVELAALGMAHPAADRAAEPPANLRILPARAMRKAFAATFGEGPECAEAAKLAEARLDDSSHDVFVATLDGVPAGRVGYLQAGDVGRLSDLFVCAEHRGRGVGRAMMTHFSHWARRLLPRIIVACADASDEYAVRFLEKCGFSAGGSLIRFVRPDSSAAAG
jgi:GNAT superfamily N-acetyltransferase